MVSEKLIKRESKFVVVTYLLGYIFNEDFKFKFKDCKFLKISVKF